MSERGRVFCFVLLSALFVTVVRGKLQYGSYFGTTVSPFLISWFLHYGALGIIAAFTAGWGEGWQRHFFTADRRESVSLEKAAYYVALVALFSSLFVLVALHWPDGAEFGEY